MSPCGERKSTTSCDDEDWPNNGGSNYGDELDLIAPGVFIPTTDIQGSFGYNTTVGSSGDYHLDFGGTSAATPHVAGVAALVLSANPNLSQDQVRDILESTAQKVGSYSYSTTTGRTNGTWSNQVGYGLVDAYESVLAAAGGPISGPDLICSTGSSFSISPPVAYDSILWSNGLTLNITSGQGTTSCSFSSTGDGNSYIRVKLYFNGDSITLPDKIVWSGKPYVSPSSIQFECADGSGYFCTNAFGNEFSFTYDNQYNYFDIKLTNLSETQTLTQFSIYSTWGTMDYFPPDGTYLFQVRGNNDCGSPTNWTKEAVDFVDCGMGGLLSLEIFPNPATEQATITIVSIEDMNAVKKTVDEEWQLEVYTQGQLLKHSVSAINDNKFVLNTSGWQPGMYFVRAYYKEKVVYGTLVVNK